MAFDDDLADAEGRVRGAVLHHFSTRANKTKYLVALNHTWPPLDGLVVYAFTTTNVAHFAAARVPEETIVRLNPATTRSSPRQPSSISRAPKRSSSPQS